MMLVGLLLTLAMHGSSQTPARLGARVATAGTIRIETGLGTTMTPSRGVMTVWFRYDLAWHPQDIQLTNGKWSAVVPRECTAVDIGRLELDGADAHVSRGSWPKDPGAAEINLVATLASKVQLTVRDAVSDVPITEFEIREWGSQWDGYMLPLDDQQGWSVPHPLTAPVSLPAWSLDHDPSFIPGVQWTPQRTFWVRAKGKAWTRVDADFAEGGDLVARLHPASSMRVILDPDRPVMNCLLDIRIDGGRGVIRLDTGTKERLFENLPDATVEVILLDETGPTAKEVTRHTATLTTGNETVVHL